ncbi:MAG: RloB family protein [Candidatus Cloacimonadales bacterium]
MGKIMARETNRRKIRKAVAIIGEGISEKYYFEQLRTEENYNFKIKPELPKNSDYYYIFKKAISLLEVDFDYVFCLIDLDILQDRGKQKRYSEAKNKLLAEADKFDGNVSIIEQYPCFEIWFLLHFQVLGKTFKSCNNLLSELKKYDFFQTYDKSRRWYERHDLYSDLKSKLDDAIGNCQKTNKNRSKAQCEIDRVIKFLRATSSA